MDIEQEFEALRAKARQQGRDIYLTIGRPIFEGETVVTTWPDGTITNGLKYGRDDLSLRDSMLVIRTILTVPNFE